MAFFGARARRQIYTKPTRFPADISFAYAPKMVTTTEEKIRDIFDRKFKNLVGLLVNAISS